MSDDLQRCAALLDAVPDPAMLVSTARRIVLANPAACELFGGALAGQSVLSFIRQPEPLAALERGLAQLARPPEGAAVPITARMIQTSPARETALQVSVSPIAPGLGSGSGSGSGLDLPLVLVTLRDVSQIEAAEQQRRDFVANVSHELRSPLTVVTGFIETLKGPARDDPAATARFLDIMEREAQRMERLVGDLLSLSRVESEERVRPRARVSVSEAVRATLAALCPQIKEQGLEVVLRDLAGGVANGRGREGLPEGKGQGDGAPESAGAGEAAREFVGGLSGGAMVIGDRDQLVQVFHNLVENALKYGASGGRIEITIERLDQCPGMSDGAVRVSIRDHGDGIDAIHLPRLTERFYRVDGHRSRAMGGTGLGLAIVKHIVNRHRGRFTIQSTRGEGSTFAVTLPLA